MNHDDSTIAQLREECRKRWDFVRTRTSLSNRAFAVCKRLSDGDATAAEKLLGQVVKGDLSTPLHIDVRAWVDPFLHAADLFGAQIKAQDREIERLAKSLDILPWAAGVKGLGVGSLGKIVGETGSFLNYDSPAKLWKRLGLAVIGGERQRKVAGDAALEHGYSPQRRSMMWVIQDCMIRAQVRKDKETGEARAIGPYGEIYLQRKVYELGKIDEDQKGRVGWAHNRASRYMIKRVIRDMWRAWRRTAGISDEAARDAA